MKHPIESFLEKIPGMRVIYADDRNISISYMGNILSIKPYVHTEETINGFNAYTGRLWCEIKKSKQ